jgi:predicted  nucleic acid-binding Zn-ribbon protein
MKKIALISFTLSPLLAGCAGHLPHVDDARVTAAPPTQHAQIADIQSQIKKLRWQIGNLKKETAPAANAQNVPDGRAQRELVEVRQRLADLERSMSNQTSASNATAAPDGGQSGTRTASDEADTRSRQISELNDKINQLAAIQKASQKQQKEMENNFEDDRTLITDYLKSLDMKLRQVELTQAKEKASQANPELAQRLTKLDASVKAITTKHDKIAEDLEKDRTLVVDYLENLTVRIEELEAKSSAPQQPTDSPPVTPSPKP